MKAAVLSCLALAACSGSSTSGASVKLHPTYGWSGTAEVLVHTPDGTLVSHTPIATSLEVAIADGDTVSVAFMNGGETDLVSMLGVSPGDAIELDVAPTKPATVNKDVNLPLFNASTWVIRTPISSSTGTQSQAATIDLPANSATVPILATIDGGVGALDFAGDPAELVGGLIDLGNKELTWQDVTIDATAVPSGSQLAAVGVMLVGPDKIRLDTTRAGAPSQIPLGFGDAVELYATAGGVSAGSVIAGTPPGAVTYDLSVPLVPALSSPTLAGDHISWQLQGGGSYDAVEAFVYSSTQTTFTWLFIAPPGTASIAYPVLPPGYAPPAFDTIQVDAYQRSDLSSYADAFRAQPLPAGTTFQERDVSFGPSPGAATGGVHGKLSLRADSLLTPDDLYLFNQGTHHRLYEKLGAHVVPGGGVWFAVWAPDATRVSVIGDWNGWEGGRTPLEPRGSSGIWEGFAAQAGPDARYKYKISSRHSGDLEKADPFALAAECPPRTASVVWNGGHEWGDAAWMAARHARNARTAPISIYELHPGSWRLNPDGSWLGYRELGHQLADHANALGFTHVELMPVMEHPFYGSWGYQVTGYFAPTARYGPPEYLMEMVDILHQHGVGVILDWVPAHFPTDAHGLGLFDGTHLFEHADPRRGFHPDWTTYVFNFGRHEVQSFLTSSAFYWLDKFHVDGLRVDGVASMLYRDYSRRAGEWIADIDGSNHDRQAITFLQQLNRAVYGAFPDVQMIAEESTAWGGVSRPPEAGGLGFGFKWDMGWMHDTLEYVKRDPVYRKHHHDQLTFRAIYADTENFVLPLSHDEVVHGKGALANKMPGDDWQRLATLRLLYGYQWTLPGKKLLFMGGEIATWHEWHHDEQLAWDLLQWPRHAGVERWVGDLNRAYREYPALHRRDCERGGFEWVVGGDAGASVLVYLRRGEPGDAPALVALNFTPIPRHGYEVGVPVAGLWREILCSDAESYGGGNIGNQGGVEAQPTPMHGRPATAVITIPPLGCVVLVAERADR